MIRCPAPALLRCRGFDTNNSLTLCGEGFDDRSPGCRECTVDYFPLDGTCSRCPADGRGVVVAVVPAIVILSIMVAMFVAVLLTIHRLFKKHGIAASKVRLFKIPFDFVVWCIVSIQILPHVARISAPGLPAALRSSFAALQLLQFDFTGVAPPSCTESTWHWFHAVLITPLLAVIAWSLLPLLAKKRSLINLQRWLRFLLLGGLCLGYPVIAYYAFSLFDCKESRGINRWSGAPNIICFQGTHLTLSVFAIFCILLLLLLPLALIGAGSHVINVVSANLLRLTATVEKSLEMTKRRNSRSRSGAAADGWSGRSAGEAPSARQGEEAVAAAAEGPQSEWVGDTAPWSSGEGTAQPWGSAAGNYSEQEWQQWTAEGMEPQQQEDQSQTTGYEGYSDEAAWQGLSTESQEWDAAAWPEAVAAPESPTASTAAVKETKGSRPRRTPRQSRSFRRRQSKRHSRTGFHHSHGAAKGGLKGGNPRDSVALPQPIEGKNRAAVASKPFTAAAAPQQQKSAPCRRCCGAIGALRRRYCVLRHVDGATHTKLRRLRAWSPLFGHGQLWFRPSSLLFLWLVSLLDASLDGDDSASVMAHRAVVGCLLLAFHGTVFWVRPDHEWGRWKRWPRVWVNAIAAFICFLQVSLAADEVSFADDYSGGSLEEQQEEELPTALPLSALSQLLVWLVTLMAVALPIVLTASFCCWLYTILGKPSCCCLRRWLNEEQRASLRHELLVDAGVEADDTEEDELLDTAAAKKAEASAATASQPLQQVNPLYSGGGGNDQAANSSIEGTGTGNEDWWWDEATGQWRNYALPTTETSIHRRRRSTATMAKLLTKKNRRNSRVLRYIKAVTALQSEDVTVTKQLRRKKGKGKQGNAAVASASEPTDKYNWENLNSEEYAAWTQYYEWFIAAFPHISDTAVIWDAFFYYYFKGGPVDGGHSSDGALNTG